MAGLAGLLLSSGDAVAQDSQDRTWVWRRCALKIPHSWIITGEDRAESPDGRVTIQMSEVASARVFVNFQRAFGVNPLPGRTADVRVLFANVGRRTRYYAVAQAGSDRACIAQVTSNRPGQNEAAETLARTLRRNRR